MISQPGARGQSSVFDSHSCFDQNATLLFIIPRKIAGDRGRWTESAFAEVPTILLFL